ncbi:MAG: hypothetical protein PHD72_03910 [Patescibacteria group bacterium]|nr:hypothetical protein [Patescibacteria group bacterium]
MVILNLNLLPEKQRQYLRLFLLLTWLKNVLTYAFFVLVILVVFLTLVYNVLVEESQNLAERTAAVNKNYNTYNVEITEINKKIQSLISSGEKYRLLSPRFFEMMNGVPADIKLRSLEMDIAGNTLSLFGTAQTRTGLLNYEQALKNLSWVEKVDLPKSQLLQKENINWQITLTVKPPTLNGATK